MESEKGVSDHKATREFSNQLDKAMGWEGGYKSESCTRAIIHGTYHDAVGYYKEAHGNSTGGKAEHARAGEQFKKCS